MINSTTYWQVKADSKRNKLQGPLPIVLWHGVGDTCCKNTSMGSIKKVLEENIPGIYVKSLQIGSNEFMDLENSYFMNVNEQVKIACSLISEDIKLKNGFNAIGFSQGAQFLRAVVQRCPNPPAINLISVGGQHQGVFGVPRCLSKSETFCDQIRKLISIAAYTDFVQNHIAQAGFWHDPLNEKEYKAKSNFLAHINNEKVKNESYRINLKKLQNFVMIKFLNDTIVEPRESEWFGFYAPGQSKEITTLQKSELYTEDWLGLKEMNEKGQLHFFEVIGDHLQIDVSWFKENIINKFLI